MATDRRALLILGMHRSGTSALTRILNIHGAALPDDLLPANTGNVTGYWESSAVVSFHDELLEAAGSRWDDPMEFPEAWFTSEAAREYVTRLTALITTDFEDAPLFVVKDPRLCRLLPIWQLALAELKVEPLAILLIRHPLETAASLLRRDGRPEDAGVLLWMQHVLAAELGSRSMRRLTVTYDQLLTDYRSVIARIESQLGVTFPRRGAVADAEAAAFLDPALRHERLSLLATGRRSDLPPWVQTTCNWFEQASRTAEPLDSTPLDGVREEVRALQALFGPALRWHLQHERDWARRAHELALQHQAALARHQAQEDQWHTRASDLESRLHEARRVAEELEAQLGREQERLRDLTTTLESHVASANQAEADLRSRVRELEETPYARLVSWWHGRRARP